MSGGETDGRRVLTLNRRRALTLIGSVGVVGTAGCLGEDGNFEYTASAAAIPSAEDAGYEADGPEAMEINETVEVGGVSKDVNIETWSAAYAEEETQASVFLFSTPDVSIAGISANPLARLDGADLITRVVDEGLGQADSDMTIEEIEEEDELTLTVLDEERTVPVFSAVLNLEEGEGPQIDGDGGEVPEGASGSEAEAIEDGELPIRLYVVSVTHEEDVLLAVGFHPEMVEAEDDIVSLLESIDHPVEVDDDSSTATE